MKLFRSITAALVLTAAAFASGQDAAETSAEARSILDRAARFQRGSEPLPMASSLYGRFYVTVNDAKGTFSADIERWFVREPERMLTRSVEAVTGTRSTVGYDDGEAWFRNDKTGEVRVYSDRPDLYDVDLERLDEQLRITSLLIDAVAMDSMISRLSNLRGAGTGSVTDLDGIEHPVEYVAASLPDVLFTNTPDDSAMIQLRFAIGRDGALRRLDVQSALRNRLSLVFGLHGTTKSGLRVPLSIKVLEITEDRANEIADLGVVEDDKGNALLVIDAPIDAKMFAVPATK